MRWVNDLHYTVLQDDNQQQRTEPQTLNFLERGNLYIDLAHQPPKHTVPILAHDEKNSLPESSCSERVLANRMECNSSSAEIGMHRECIATLLEGDVDPVPPNVRKDSDPNKAVSNIC